MKRLPALPLMIGIATAPVFGVQFDLVNNSSVTVNTAVFEKFTPQPTGTGVFNPFLRVQGNGNSGVETGFNTSNTDNPPNYDAKGGIWTHDLLFSDLATVNKDGTDYYQFVLDLGEPGNGGANSEIRLNTFDIYSSSVASKTQGNDPVTGINDDPSNLGDLEFSLGDNSVLMVDESSGNGQADIRISIPKSFFLNVDPYLYLYVDFGNSERNGEGTADGSFEEIAALLGPTSVPDGGATAALLGLGILGLAAIRRKS